VFTLACLCFCGGGCRFGNQFFRHADLVDYASKRLLEAVLLALVFLAGLGLLALGWWHLPRRRRAGEAGVADRIVIVLAVAFLTSVSAFILFFTACFGGVVMSL